MPVDIGKTIRDALSQLRGERDRLDRQIAALQSALAEMDGKAGDAAMPHASRAAVNAVPAASRRGRRKRAVMSAAARKAVSERMKAYWAKRRVNGKKPSASDRKKAGSSGKKGA